MVPKVVRYDIKSDKVERELRLLYLTDLHGSSYGEDNADLIALCRHLKPDLILCGGDMITARRRPTHLLAASFLRQLTEIAPVCAVNGNHETCIRRNDRKVGLVYSTYIDDIKEAGVRVLNNESCRLTIKGNDLTVTGFEAPYASYKKLRRPRLNPRALPPIPADREETFSILLAHNPAFVPLYLRYGADLTLSGHYHGGIMRFGRHGVLASPYVCPLPRYGYGHYRLGDRHAIVSSGLGEHTIPFRINNPFEAVLIRVR